MGEIERDKVGFFVQKDVLHTIKANLTGFSKGQRRIANYILENYDKAAFMTASKLGKIAQVSESTAARSRPWSRIANASQMSAA